MNGHRGGQGPGEPVAARQTGPRPSDASREDTPGGPGSASGRPAPESSLARRVLTSCSLAATAAPGALVLYVLISLATGALPVIAAWLTKALVDRLAAGISVEGLFTVAAGLALIGVLAGTSPQVTQYLRAQLDRRVGQIALNRLFVAVDSFTGLGHFENPRFLDRLRLAQQASRVSPNQTVEGLLGMVRAVITLTGFIGSLLVLDPLIAAFVLASGMPMLGAEISLSRRRARMMWAVSPAERREAFYSELLSTVQAAKEVRLFGLGGFLRGRMLAERRFADASARTVERREVVFQAGLGLVGASVSGAGLVWAAMAAQRGALSVGDVMIFVAAVAGTQGALVMLAGDVARCHQALSMFDHFIAVTTAPPDLPSPAAPEPLPALSEGIELRDVWFRYAEDQPWVLRGVDLHIPYGTSLGLVGLNGAGKSTLVKLLCRFYDPTRGAILWDGVDLCRTDPAELRGRIGAVFQDYMEYELSAAENIALGDLSALTDERRIHAAARNAGIHDELRRLHRGYETLLSRRFFMESNEEDRDLGTVLSGGQWQRLALARAFLRHERDLAILDEPSSGLDAAAEHAIHTSLQKYRDGRTSLLISHRLGVLRSADRIVVLSDGHITEQGTHTELVAEDGEYARLFALQAAGYRPEHARTEGGRP
ncbi:ABC transporter ATP-binding protein [Streptomyces sp. NPDC057429]|uniref:ABC transporter ATP-binding protein n=1 Tax=Streptomyces sp. NPDC057429 TaxID=3346130 RepID=UPI0036C2BEF0